MGLMMEHEERMMWADQDGITAYDTTRDSGMTTSTSHAVTPEDMVYPDGEANFERTERNWSTD